MFQQVKIPRLLPDSLGLAIVVITYISTRGPDGSLFLACVGFTCIGGLYLLTTILRHPTLFDYLRHFIVFELAVSLGLYSADDLDEMGGAFFILLPAGVLLIVVGSAVIATVVHLYQSQFDDPK